MLTVKDHENSAAIVKLEATIGLFRDKGHTRPRRELTKSPCLPRGENFFFITCIVVCFNMHISFG